MLVTPIVVYRVLADDFIQRDQDLTTSEFQKLSELRLISFGIFAALLLVIWGPFLLWKGIVSLVCSRAGIIANQLVLEGSLQNETVDSRMEQDRPTG